jgi:hypothetical protein
MLETKTRATVNFTHQGSTFKCTQRVCLQIAALSKADEQTNLELSPRQDLLMTNSEDTTINMIPEEHTTPTGQQDQHLSCHAV